MPLMKRHGHTALLLVLVLGAPLLASAIVTRGKETDKIRLNQPNPASTVEPDDSINHLSDPPVSVAAPAPPRHFEMFKIINRKSIKELESRLGADGFTAMLKINRTDRNHLRAGNSLIVPVSGADLMRLAPFPADLGIAKAITKLLLVSRRVQAFGAYEWGKLVRWGPTSTGKKSTPTPAGLYHTNWKAKETRSSVNQSWVLPWCFNLDNFSGVSFHKFDLPGYPASHGCVRLLEEDAKWIYDWAEQWTLSKSDKSILTFGTPVLIFGDYAYGEKPLWKRLVDDPIATEISVADTEAVLTQHMTAIVKKSRMGRPPNPVEQIPSVAAAAVPISHQ